MNSADLRLKKIISYFSVVFIICTFSASLTGHAATCVSGCNQQINLVATKSLSGAENQVAAIFNSNNVSVAPFRYNSGPGNNYIWSTLVYPDNPDVTTATYNYFRVDDYLSVGVRMDDPPCAKVYYPPVSFAALDGNLPCMPVKVGPFYENTQTNKVFRTQFYVKKRMIGGSYVVNRKVLSYFFSSVQWGREAHIADVYVQGNITVPENCVIDAGTVITMNFGNIPSANFIASGGKPEGVNPIVRNLSVQCTNVAAQASLGLRLQADSVSGSAVVSNNKDVGFVVEDSNGSVLLPNNISSVIPFVLDDAGRANVAISVYPVSVTGNKPVEGAVTSRAYLRVDFY